MWLTNKELLKLYTFLFLAIRTNLLSWTSSVTGYGLNEQLYLDVVYPEDVAYTYKIRQARDFSDTFSSQLRNVRLIATNPPHACGRLIENGQLLRGQVALIERGECSFMTKAVNAELYGAVSVIIMDNKHDDIDQWIDMVRDETNRRVGIPSYFMLGKDGKMITESLKSHNLPAAIINLPVNYTNRMVVHHPPWNYW
uniref:Protease-associated domain-containing protein 1-like n=1 Tax=Phallusia mammillata TaxID=59560 RepID=A0A6F9DQF1_9ASCI|nr:protease-associated domain-containing protein 1-like [Phallusia mammillata]